ncbi:uncharacterized protein [Choristoneura fumiferana]|uniref:uncharacterized protein n=1 Tax=Choristoneura fumiferana TaxID=7141 RepID=UPI003D156617
MVLDMFVLLLLYFGGVYCQAPIDEYVLNFDSPVYVCSDMESQSWVDTSGLEVVRYNETTAYMTGTINFLKGLDYSTMVELEVYKELSGQYEKTISHEICNLCNEIGKKDSLYFKYLKYFGFPDACPFAAGTYSVQDLKPDDADMPVNAATSGRYQVNINLYKNPDGTCKNMKTFIGCLKLDFIIEEL